LNPVRDPELPLPRFSSSGETRREITRSLLEILKDRQDNQHHRDDGEPAQCGTCGHCNRKMGDKQK
jgi:hypothetical protein